MVNTFQHGLKRAEGDRKPSELFILFIRPWGPAVSLPPSCGGEQYLNGNDVVDETLLTLFKRVLLLWSLQVLARQSLQHIYKIQFSSPLFHFAKPHVVRGAAGAAGACRGGAFPGGRSPSGGT